MVIWTDVAISHITKFIDDAEDGTTETAKFYMQKLVDYTEILNTLPEIGKNMLYIINNYEIRQLIYRKHRIIYHIKNDSVVILAVLHTRLDISKALRKLKN